MKKNEIFEKELSKEEKARQWVLIKREIDELNEKLRKKQFCKEEYRLATERIRTLKEEKKELAKDLTDEDYRNAKNKIRIIMRQNNSDFIFCNNIIILCISDKTTHFLFSFRINIYIKVT